MEMVLPSSVPEPLVVTEPDETHVALIKSTACVLDAAEINRPKPTNRFRNLMGKILVAEDWQPPGREVLWCHNNFFLETVKVFNYPNCAMGRFFKKKLELI